MSNPSFQITEEQARELLKYVAFVATPDEWMRTHLEVNFDATIETLKSYNIIIKSPLEEARENYIYDCDPGNKASTSNLIGSGNVLINEQGKEIERLEKRISELEKK